MAKDIRTNDQVSAGGVAYRSENGKTEVVLISVGEQERWQLPKGRVSKGETHEQAAQREVREEAGVDTEMVAPIESIDYWFYVSRAGKSVRIHKYVHFFLLRYLAGDPSQHDQEVNQAAWVEIDQAVDLLAFEGEKGVLRKAREMLT